MSPNFPNSPCGWLPMWLIHKIEKTNGKKKKKTLITSRYLDKCCPVQGIWTSLGQVRVLDKTFNSFITQQNGWIVMEVIWVPTQMAILNFHCILAYRGREQEIKTSRGMNFISFVLVQCCSCPYFKQFIFDLLSTHVQKIFHTIQPIFTFILVWSWCAFLFGLLCIKWNLQHIKVISKVRLLGARTANFSIIGHQMHDWEWKFYKME